LEDGKYSEDDKYSGLEQLAIKMQIMPVSKILVFMERECFCVNL